MNNIVVIKLSINSIPYSLIKIRANNPPPYSILNPDTISDSPSAVSKGVRLDSAKQSKSQIIISRGIDRAPHIPCCTVCILIDLYENHK